MIARLREFRIEYGREDHPFEIHVISREGFTSDGLKRLEELGVTDAIVSFRSGYESAAMSVEEKIAAIHKFSADVMSKL